MGLTICKRIVDNCGGEISCKSEGVNQGSIFDFSMKMNIGEKARTFASGTSKTKEA